MRSNEGFVRSPAARGELLRGREQRKRALKRCLVFGIAENEIGTPSGRECNGVGVGVLARKRIAVMRQRIEQLAVEEIAMRKLVELGIVRELSGEEKVLRHDVSLIIGRIFLTDAVATSRGKQGLGSGEHPVQQVGRIRNVGA